MGAWLGVLDVVLLASVPLLWCFGCFAIVDQCVAVTLSRCLWMQLLCARSPVLCLLTGRWGCVGVWDTWFLLAVSKVLEELVD